MWKERLAAIGIRYNLRSYSHSECNVPAFHTFFIQFCTFPSILISNFFNYIWCHKCNLQPCRSLREKTMTMRVIPVCIFYVFNILYYYKYAYACSISTCSILLSPLLFFSLMWINIHVHDFKLIYRYLMFNVSHTSLTIVVYK